MIRVSYVGVQPQILTAISKIIGPSYQINEYNQKIISDIYFIEIDNETDINQYRYIKHRNPTSLIIIIGNDDNNLMRKCYTLEPLGYIRINNLESDLLEIKSMLNQVIPTRFKTYQFNTKNSKASIRLNTIYYIESFKHYIHIHTKTGTYIERKNISQFLLEMLNDGFIQIHKSYAINLDNIRSININEVELVNGEKLLIGQKYKEMLINAYQER